MGTVPRECEAKGRGTACPPAGPPAERIFARRHTKIWGVLYNLLLDLPGESRQVGFSVQGLPDQAFFSHSLHSTTFAAATAAWGRSGTVSALWGSWLLAPPELLYPPRQRASELCSNFSLLIRGLLERPPHLTSGQTNDIARDNHHHAASLSIWSPALPSLLAAAAEATQIVLQPFLLPLLLPFQLLLSSRLFHARSHGRHHGCLLARASHREVSILPKRQPRGLRDRR
jgi:hypothetical protein